jgi:hypothetical protein
MLHKVFTPVSVIYKGSGFYSTDHRSSSGSNFSSAKKDETKPETPKPEKKTESEKTKSPAAKSGD